MRILNMTANLIGRIANAFGLLPSAGIDMRPIDGVSDDMPRLAAAIDAWSGKGWVRMLPGLAGQAWQIKTAVELLNKSPWIMGTQNTVVNMGLATDASLHWIGFYCRDTADVSVTSTTLAATPTVGAITVSSNGDVAVGKRIRINSANGDMAQIFKVIPGAAHGSGPFTLTLDAPVEFAFASGDALIGIFPPLNPRIHGDGMTFTGTGSAAFGFAGAQGGEVKDLVFDGTTLDWGPGFFDVGSRDVAIRRIRVTSNLLGGGIGLHGLVGGTADGCRIRKCAATGISIASSRRITVRDCLLDECDKGVEVSSLVAGGNGSRDVAISDTQCTKCTTYGFTVIDGSIRVGFVNCGAAFGALHGFIVAPNGGASPDGVNLTNSFSKGNVGSGFHVNNATATLTGCRAEGNGSGSSQYADLVATAGAIVNAVNFTSRDPVSVSAITVLGNSTFNGYGLDLGVTRSGNYAAITCDGVNGGTQLVNVCGVRGSASGGNTKEGYVSLTSAACHWNVSHSLLDGFKYGTDLSTAASTFRRGVNMGFTNGVAGGAAYPFPNTGRYNYGTLTANGVTGVDVSFADIQADDVIVFTLHTIGGVVGHPKYTITAGSKFTFTSDATDTSVWEWRIL